MRALHSLYDALFLKTFCFMSLTLAVKENDGKIPYNEKSILPNMPNIEMKRTATPSIQNDQIPS